jgi:transposase InsO family protein
LDDSFRAYEQVVKALDMALKRLPMGLKGIHSDSGSEFLNRPVDKWRQRNHVEFTRGRPTHKNDNCYVEQKNYATVRKIAGCFRYTGEAGVAALQSVYDAYDPLLNLYYPCMKQISCERAGAKKKRKYDAAKTPFLRLSACSTVLWLSRILVRSLNKKKSWTKPLKTY